MIAVRTILQAPVYEVQIGQAIHGLTRGELMDLRNRVDAAIVGVEAVPAIVIAETAKEFNVTPAIILGDRKFAAHAMPRMVCMWLLRQHGMSQQQAGEVLGRNHVAIRNGQMSTENRRSTEPDFKVRTDALQARVNEQLERKESHANPA